MVSPPYWIYNRFNVVEGGGMEKGKEGDDFHLKEEEWQFHYQSPKKPPAIQQVDTPHTHTHTPYPRVLIKSEGALLWAFQQRGAIIDHTQEPIRGIRRRQ